MKKRTKTLLGIIFTILTLLAFFAVGIIFIVEKTYPLGILFFILPFIIVGVSWYAVKCQSKNNKE